jgi:hypothetical protein
MARYPFAAESRQSRLDVIYAYARRFGIINDADDTR